MISHCFITGPMNPIVFSVTSSVILAGFAGLSYLLFHHFTDPNELMLSIANTTEPPQPMIVAKELQDSILYEVPKVLLPEQDTLDRTFPNIITRNYSGHTEVIPDKFDARENWPNCAEVIGKVWDQGTCQACWAVSAASVMTDRLCIKSNAAIKPVLSPQHLICSCKNCTANNSPSLPMPMCNGGNSEAAWEFWMNEGLVTGGDYGTNDSCLPYLSPPCNHDHGSPAPSDKIVACGLNPVGYTCPETCANSKTSISNESKYTGSEIYYIQNKTEDIQTEIKLNGPVQAKFKFDDKVFGQHKKGLYSCTGKEVHIHSVKIIGWGNTESGEPFWVCVNSFNNHWGESGLFRIKRGVNMCLIEESVMAGTPNVPKTTPASSTVAPTSPTTTPSS